MWFYKLLYNSLVQILQTTNQKSNKIIIKVQNLFKKYVYLYR